jgi:CubicO group peptidase (beta-lactamase class C family)
MFNLSQGLAPEIPAGNGTGTARGLARLYAILSMGGELDGIRLLSPEAVGVFSAQQIQMTDVVLASVMPRLLRKIAVPPVRRTLGYLMNPRMPGGVHTFGPNLDAYGHDGAGGQIAFCDPEHRISVGFVRNDLGSSPKLSNRLIKALYGCAGVATKPKKASGRSSTPATA